MRGIAYYRKKPDGMLLLVVVCCSCVVLSCSHHHHLSCRTISDLGNGIVWSAVLGGSTVTKQALQTRQYGGPYLRRITYRYPIIRTLFLENTIHSTVLIGYAILRKYNPPYRRVWSACFVM
jgi:hypothetical protein